MENLVMYDRLSSYYSGRKIFVTGHTGFKGSWLVSCLHLLGARVKGYALAPEYDNGLFSLLKPLNVCETTIADVRNKVQLEKEINLFQPDYVFHLAAQPLVRRSYKIPAETFDVNVGGTANVLEAVSHLQKRCTVVVVTTDKVYQNKETNMLYSEEDPLGGFDPYSASKACAELVVTSFRYSFFNAAQYQSHQKAVATARAGNVIGGGDWSDDRIIPDIVRSLQNGAPVEVRNPNAVRPWQHVLEPMAGYLLLGGLLNEHATEFSRAFNFGPAPEDHLSVSQLVEIAIREWGSGNWKDVSAEGQPHEAGLLKLDISLAEHELGWVPKLRSEQAVKWAIDWYKMPINKQAEFAFQQIKSYFDL